MNYNQLINLAKEKGFSDIEITESSSSVTNITVFSGEIDQNHTHDEVTITVRAIYNDKMAYFTTSNADEDPNFILDTLKENALSLTTQEEFEIFGGSEEYPEWEEKDGGFSKISLAEKVNLLLVLEKEVKAYDERIILVPHCGYQELIGRKRIVNSKGLDLEKRKEYGVVYVQAVGKENEQTQSAFEVEIKTSFADLDPILIAQKVAKKTIKKLNADSLPSKVYPVVFENEAMADLLEVFTSFFSGEAAVKKLTPLLGKEGEKVFSELLTIVDEAIYPDSPHNEPFDDEGVACYKKEVVDKGVFKTFLHNLKTAKYFKTKSTGNGFKAGDSISVRGVNFYVKPGERKLEEMIADIEEGVLITDLAGLHAGANPVNGDFSAQSSGFLIKDGKIDRPVTLIVVSGNFVEALNQIEEIGSDLKFNSEGIGCPSIRFKGLSISGK
ncbi:MAG TPA: TldD/PmbA family protein [Acholeplasmataceae bacterium]|nr:TldD/PmbA family protein [Acholeplasmataceae bacterium]